MKTILMIASLLTTAVVSAMPAVGDLALYNITSIDAGVTYNYTLEQKLTAQNVLTGDFNVSQTVTYNGVTQATEYAVPADQLATTQMIDLYLNNCALAGGTLETVTVPAGTFNTCAVKDENNNTTWIAQVPFGFVKMSGVTEDGAQQVVELQSYVNGQ